MPTGPDGIHEASNLSSPDTSGADQFRDGTVDERNHFTGVVSQTDLIFRFDDSPDWRWGSSWSGSLNGAGFTMNLPTRGGSLAALEFREADVKDYNSAVEQAKPAKS